MASLITACAVPLVGSVLLTQRHTCPEEPTVKSRHQHSVGNKYSKSTGMRVITLKDYEICLLCSPLASALFFQSVLTPNLKDLARESCSEFI